MNRRLLWLVCGMLVLGPQEALAQGWTGTWRLDLDVSGDDPMLPYMLRITKDEQTLVVERVWLESTKTAEAMRYYLDGRVTTHVEAGQLIESTVALDGPSVIVTSTIKRDDGHAWQTTDVYRVLRNRLEIERTVGESGKEAGNRLVFVRLPGNVPLHGGTGDSR